MLFDAINSQSHTIENKSHHFCRFLLSSPIIQKLCGAYKEDGIGN